MSYLGAGHSSDVEQDKLTSDFRSLNRSNTNLATKSKFADVLWNHHKDDSDSEISDSGNFLAKGKIDLFNFNYNLHFTASFSWILHFFPNSTFFHAISCICPM